MPAQDWTPDASGRWYLQWQTPSFCAGRYYERHYMDQTAGGPCAHSDMYGDPDYPAAGDPQLVFIDDVHQRQVGTLDEVEPGTFYSDWANRKIYIGEEPSGKTIELAARPVALVLGGELTGRAATTLRRVVRRGARAVLENALAEVRRCVLRQVIHRRRVIHRGAQP